MVYTVDRVPAYNFHKSERDKSRAYLADNPSPLLSRWSMDIFKYMIHRADDMSRLEEPQWETHD